MEKNKKSNFIIKRLKKWEKTRDEAGGWENRFEVLNEKIKESNKSQEDIEKAIDIVSRLKNIIEESVKEYIEKDKIDLNKVEVINDEKEYKKLERDIMFELKDHYPVNLDDLEIKNSFNVLNLSINPGSTQKETQGNNSEEGKLDNISMPLYSFDFDKKLPKKIEYIIKEYGINEKYIWRKYYNPNFEIFKGINAKYPWVALKEETIKAEFKAILQKQSDNMGNKFSEEQQKNHLEELMKLYAKERNDYDEKKPLVFFNDLFWIADSNQKELLSILERYKDKNEIKNFVKEIIDLYIEKYKLSLIVVTNVKAVKYIKNAIEDENEENCMVEYRYIDKKTKNEKMIPIIYSGYLANGMDQFSKIRLRNDIKKCYKQK